MQNARPESQADRIERRERLVNLLVVSGCIIFDLLLGFRSLKTTTDTPLTVVGGSLMSCQISLLTAWVALGQGKFRDRLLCVAPVYIWVAWKLGAGDDPWEVDWGNFGFTLLLLYLINAAIPYGILRLCDAYCVRWDQPDRLQSAERRRRPVQFSILGLFGITFCAACFAWLVRWIKPSLDESLAELTLFSLLSLFALGGIWAMLAARASPRRVVLFFGGCILGGLALVQTLTALTRAHTEQLRFVVSVAIHLSAMLSILWFYRRLGYRAVRGELVANDATSIERAK